MRRALSKRQQVAIGVVVDGCGYHSRIDCDQSGSQFDCCYPVYRVAAPSEETT